MNLVLAVVSSIFSSEMEAKLEASKKKTKRMLERPQEEKDLDFTVDGVLLDFMFWVLNTPPFLLFALFYVFFRCFFF